MIRFPNPSSTISNFAQVYNIAFERLCGQVFDLDSMVAAIIDENMATSSGYSGTEALTRSTRRNRSLDPLYNQLKMYSELFRSLGWIHPTEQRALIFTFTLLGRQVAEAKQHYLPLMQETVLGISYPNHVIGVRSDQEIRPFASMLLTMLASGNALSRDEMIVVPLSVGSDRANDALMNMVDLIETLRESREKIRAALLDVAAKRNVQVNTLQNYTRWPIAVMLHFGWTEKARRRFRTGGRSFGVYQLTETGKRIAEGLSAFDDLRADQVSKLPMEEKTAVSIHAHYRMLERAGFDLESVDMKLREQEPALERALSLLGVPQGRPLLFSPFQALSIEDIAEIFPPTQAPDPMEERNIVAGRTMVGRGSRDHLFVQPKFVPQLREDVNSETRKLERELQEVRERHSSAEEAAAAFAQSHETDTQTQFYPLVCELFRLLGFESENSPVGNNYQRWDGWVDLAGTVIPMEIKSPTEEMSLSTKAIRQALENKVVVLSREGLHTTRDTTTLAIGYQIPNERGEMSSLIDDIYVAFDIRIGVIDFFALTLLVIRAVTENLTILPDQLRTLKGFLHV